MVTYTIPNLGIQVVLNPKEGTNLEPTTRSHCRSLNPKP